MIPLEPDTFYHIYNRANGSEKVFLSDDNYSFFLRQYTTYISPIANSYCYCLMPNHFHLLISIKSEEELMATLPKSGKVLERLLSNQFGRLFTSYAKAFNKQQDRMGSVFMKNFKRKKIADEKYRRKIVHYIHYNPVEARLCKKPEDWKYSSYRELIQQQPTMIRRAEVLDWFEDKENFIYCHKNPPKQTGIE